MSPHSHAANKYVAVLNGDHEHCSSHRHGKRAVNLLIYRKSALHILLNFSQNPHDISNNRHDGKRTLDEKFKMVIRSPCADWRDFYPRGFLLMAAAKPLILTVAAVIAVGGVGWLMFDSASTVTSAPASDQTTTKPASAAAAPLAPGSTTATSAATATSAPAASSSSIPSRPPSLRPEASANAASIAEASRTGKFPERLSPLMAPKTFDPAAFAANPQAYLDVIEPGRVFQSAAPGAQVPVLQAKATNSFSIPVGGSCTLAVITAAKSPVTFTAFDLGTFSNSLTSITVQANDQGEASTVYHASGGVIANAQVLAGSPGASGQVQFHIFVSTPPAADKPVAAK